MWTFVAHNMIMRKHALKQSRFFVDQQLGDPQITVGYLQERLARGDTSFTNKLLYWCKSARYGSALASETQRASCLGRVHGK